MKKAEMKKEPAIKSGFRMTDEQHYELMEKLFQVESMVRVLGESCYQKGLGPKENQPIMDVANCLILVQDKVRGIQRLLDN